MKSDEVALESGRLHALVSGDEVGHGALRLQGAKRLGDRLVVDGGEEEGGLELAGFHVIERSW